MPRREIQYKQTSFRDRQIKEGGFFMRKNRLLSLLLALVMLKQPMEKGGLKV